MQGKVLANYCKTDTALVKEQKRIEKELSDFEQHIWGHETDESADSISVKDEKDGNVKEKEKTKSSSKNSRRASAAQKNDDEPKAEKKEKSDKGFFSNSSSSSTPRVTVRRQRR